MKVEDFFKTVQSFVNENRKAQRHWYTSSFSEKNKDVYFKEPAFIIGKFDYGDDEVTVLINGKVAMLWTNIGAAPSKIFLESGINELEIQLFNAQTYRGAARITPEGWNYRVCFTAEKSDITQCFNDGEDIPEKKGSRHGKTFMVAKATVFVDELTGEIKFQNINQDLWKQ
jgi:hypothetical protein